MTARWRAFFSRLKGFFKIFGSFRHWLGWVFEGEALERVVAKKTHRKGRFLRWVLSSEELGEEDQGASPERREGFWRWLLKPEFLEGPAAIRPPHQREGFLSWLFKRETL